MKATCKHPIEWDKRLFIGAHLHLSVYKATVRDKIWSKRDSNYVKDEKLRNPFNRNHRFDTDGDL